MSKITHDASGRELCGTCAPGTEEANHPVGMIFVGWGHGWQPCKTCGGSGLASTKHCSDSHCELPFGHTGAHRMGLYIRVQD
jgi:hypothetical protein